MKDDRLLRELFDIVDLCVFITDMTGKVVDSNKTAKVSTSAESPEIFGILPSLKSIWDDVVFSEGTKVNNISLSRISYLNYLKNDEEDDGSRLLAALPMKVRNPEGENFSSQVSIYRSSTVKYIYIIFNSDRKGSIVSAQDSLPLIMDEFQYEGILNHIPGVVYRCMLDEKWTMLFMSEHVESITGFPAEEYIGNAGKSFADIIHPDDRDFVEKTVMEAVEKDDPFIMEYRIVHKNGSCIWVREYGRLGGSFESGNRYLDGSIFDIADLKDAEENLREAIKVAEEAAEAKARFLANMSHEIRTPMNSILGFIDVALDASELTTETRGYLKTAKKSANALLDLINDILDVSKVEAGSMLIDRMVFNMEEVIRHVVDMMIIKASEKGLDLKYSIEEGIKSCRYGDSGKFRQILINLVGNAIKFTDSGSVGIEVKKTIKKNRVHFIVYDTGIGMTPEQADNVFSPFTQADASTSRKYGGTGLGTTISKNFVELMDGEIWIESEVGSGTEFHFVINLEEVECNEACQDLHDEIEEGKQNVSTRAFRILMAEDIPENVQLALINLKKKGHIVDVAGNGQEAVEKYRSSEYDVVLMDIQMPVLNGLDATVAIRAIEKEQNRRTPIIALTASILKEDRQKCLDMGMDMVLSKPVNFADLFKVMESVVPDDKGSFTVIQKEETVRNDLSKFAPVAGVADVKSALGLWGDEKVYMEALKSFAERYADTYHKSVENVNENTEEVRMIMHAVKGVAANLKLNRLAKVAADIDSWLKSGDAEVAEKYLPQYADALNEIIEAVSKLSKGKSLNEVALDSGFREKLALLREKLDEDSPDAVEDIIDELLEYGLPEIKEIKDNVFNFDFDIAKKCVDRIIIEFDGEK
jgi:PAS domain S-box-containing protein